MERRYALTGKTPEKPFTGQALAIWNVMSVQTDGKVAARTGREWTELAKPHFKTNQDPYRVVLYYLIIFKKRGFAAVVETTPPPTPPTVDVEDAAHALEELRAEVEAEAETVETE